MKLYEIILNRKTPIILGIYFWAARTFLSFVSIRKFGWDAYFSEIISIWTSPILLVIVFIIIQFIFQELRKLADPLDPTNMAKKNKLSKLFILKQEGYFGYQIFIRKIRYKLQHKIVLILAGSIFIMMMYTTLGPYLVAGGVFDKMGTIYLEDDRVLVILVMIIWPLGVATNFAYIFASIAITLQFVLAMNELAPSTSRLVSDFNPFDVNKEPSSQPNDISYENVNLEDLTKEEIEQIELFNFLGISLIDKMVETDAIQNRQIFNAYASFSIKQFKRNANPVASFALKAAILGVFGITAGNLFTIREFSSTFLQVPFYLNSLYIVNILLIVLLITIFFYPQKSFHDLIMNGKTILVNRLQGLAQYKLANYFILQDQKFLQPTEVDEVVETNVDKLISEIEFLNSQLQYIDGLLTWPFNYNQLFTLLGTIIVSTLGIIIPFIA